MKNNKIYNLIVRIKKHINKKMLLDNQQPKDKQKNHQENENFVYEWIQKNTEQGTFDIVTGYFTIGALAYLSEQTNQKISQYRFILGDIVHENENEINVLNLLNENITIDTSLKLNQLAQQAVEFLELKKVDIKTLEPNFCHAKLYLHTAIKDKRFNYFISGSSNLTDAGIGRKNFLNNIELNIAETGNNEQFKQLAKWFDDLWKHTQAHTKKTIFENGKKTTKDFKQYLIDEISKIFKIYSPEQIYYKILFELFHQEEIDAETQKRQTKLEDSVIYNKLFDYQQAGVKSLLSMLKKYNGAVLADAVGLGKTWTALAVMRAFQTDHEIVVFCPKKLEQNWVQYYRKNNSIFEEDKLDFEIRFHTDLRQNGLTRNHVASDYFTNDKQKLFVIDESHNLRNDKSSRYKFLVDIMQQSTGDIKVLLLSATPINNDFKDIRNQFRLIAKGYNDGFSQSLNIKNLEYSFKSVQQNFNEWSKKPSGRLADFHTKIKDSSFFHLTDNLLVARTRKLVKTHFNNSLDFPIHNNPQNIFITPMKFGDVETFGELMDKLNLNLSAYRPSYYTQSVEERNNKNKNKGVKDKVLKDNVQREFFLIKMMQILLLKRLESSWSSFETTVQNMYEHHKNALEKIKTYKEQQKNEDFEGNFDFEDEDENEKIELTLGKKKPIHISEIDNAGNLEEFRQAIVKDKDSLKIILDNIEEFSKKIQKDKAKKTTDPKLQKLFKLITEKQQTANKKVIIFTAYADTANYLFEQFKKHEFEKFAMVTGTENKDEQNNSYKKHATLLERFAPYTKVFKEKNWKNFPDDIEFTYENWKNWIKNNDNNTYNILENEIDILIATDVLSEGQNLQDADMVINYDVHWNPVRVVQRVGRIDRIGSPNSTIQCINFWPSKDIDDYINLKNRVSKRMAIMQFGGAEIIENFTDDFAELAKNQELEERQTANLLQQMQTSLDDIDTDASLGFDDFSFDNYRQFLENQLNQTANYLKNMPNGVFSGFEVQNNALQKGLIALLGYPSKQHNTAKYLSYELIYIDLEGNQLSNNHRTILEILHEHHTAERKIDIQIEKGNPQSIQKLSNALQKWIEKQAKQEVELEDGSTKKIASDKQVNLLDAFDTNPQQVREQEKTEGTISEKYQFNKFDLIAWLIIS